MRAAKKHFHKITPMIEPSRKLIRQWKRLDRYSQFDFGKPYDALTSKQMSELHYNINTGNLDQRIEEKEAEDKRQKEIVERTPTEITTEQVSELVGTL